ncbi:hypothetical protein [Actinoplanes utahensis]|nr:hypothetical protein [Actinoplanes utahensis]
MIAAALAIIPVLGVGIGTVITSSGSTPPPSAPTTLPEESPRYVVVAGQGGSERAVDGKTPIRYQHDCEGAIAAATNYVSSATRMEWVRPYGDKLIGQITDAGAESMESHREGMRTAVNSGIALEPHPEWGGFQVLACDPHSATINLWECMVVRSGDDPQRTCTTAATVVTWAADDWKLRRYETLPEDHVPGDTLDAVPGDAPLPADQRREALRAAGPGWQEYSNAPQDVENEASSRSLSSR